MLLHLGSFITVRPSTAWAGCNTSYEGEGLGKVRHFDHLLR